MYYRLSLRSQRCRSNKPDNPIFSSSSPLSCLLSGRRAAWKETEKKMDRLDSARRWKERCRPVLSATSLYPLSSARRLYAVSVSRKRARNAFFVCPRETQIVILADWIGILAVRCLNEV